MGRKLRDPAWHTVYADGTPFPASDYPAARTLGPGSPPRGADGVRRGSDGCAGSASTPKRCSTPVKPARMRWWHRSPTSPTAWPPSPRSAKPRRYRTLVEHAPEAIVVLDPDGGHFVDVNENAIRLFGLPRAALLALGPLELSAPVQLDGRSSAEAAPAYIAAAVCGETPVFEWVHRDADGWDITCEVRLVRLRSGERWLVRGSILDIGERKRIEAALRESEAKFAAVFRVCPESISISSVDDGVYVDVNDAYEQVVGYRRDRVLGRSALDLGVWVDALERRDLARRLGETDPGLRRQHPARGRRIRIARMSAGTLELTASAASSSGAMSPGRRSRKRRCAWPRACSRAPPRILITDRAAASSRSTRPSPAAGHTEAEARGRQPSLRLPGAMTAASSTRCGRHQPQQALAWRGLEPRSRRGAPLPHHHQHLRDDRGTVLNYVGAARHLHHQAVAAAARVPPTTTPCRPGQPQLVLYTLKVRIEKAARHRRQLAVVVVDLDNFKVINDTLGHDVGDVLLSEIAKRIKTCVRQEDVVCRLGGDEFTVYIEDFVDAQALVGTAQRLTQAISESCHITGHDIFVTGSIGISVCPNDGKTTSELLKNADTAMYKAKEQGKNGFQFFREDMNARAFERLVFVSGLRRALERGEFRLVYQPQVHLLDRHVQGAGVSVALEPSGHGDPARLVHPGGRGDRADRADRECVPGSLQATARVGRGVGAGVGERVGTPVPPARAQWTSSPPA